MNVYMSPEFRGPDEGDGGIRRVVEAQKRYLPEFGIQFVDSIEKADLHAIHAAATVRHDKPVVAHGHGLYWTAEEPGWAKWAWKLNLGVIAAMRRAAVVTVPSEWVAHSIRRGMLIDPTVIPHGIEVEEWEPNAERGAYVLWNKTRVDPVCDPTPIRELARRAPQQSFVTTFGAGNMDNVRILGRQSFADMKTTIERAAVYLATPRETFGIGTLEAMAAAVPILGWDWGGQPDIVEHGVTGWLSPPGDYVHLMEGLHWCVANRQEVGAAGRDAARRFTWEAACEEYAQVYARAIAVGSHDGPRTSVIVPCYNQAAFLEGCVRSVLASTDLDLEVVIVDDCSPDETAAVATELAELDQRVRYVRTPRNLYLAGARNFGISHASGRYILPLDADDELPLHAVAVLAESLDSNRSIDIAYGGMEVIEEDGRHTVGEWPPAEFNWRLQVTQRRTGGGGHNQLPYASMYRREVWERTGGYRERCKTAEDADFWTRASSYGFQPKRVTSSPTLIKRDHKNSMGYTVPEPDWTRWFGWNRSHGSEGAVPFGVAAEPPNNRESWPVLSHADPVVSIIVPVGPGHGELVRQALDSCVAQVDPRWEVIVIDDTGGEHVRLEGFPFVTRIATEGGPRGVAHARNLGIAAARGTQLVFLDADDWLQPEFLSMCLPVAEETCQVAAPDWYALLPDGEVEVKTREDHGINAVRRQAQHVVTAMYPADAIRKVGGFDEEIGWEDWDLAIALRSIGVCAKHVPHPLMTYRMDTGARREAAYGNREELKQRILNKWHRFYGGKEEFMPCGGCGGRRSRAAPAAAAQSAPQAVRTSGGTMMAETAEGLVLVEYTGTNLGKFQMRGRGTGTRYTFAQTQHHRQRYVDARDVEALVARSDFRSVVVEAPPQEPEPVPPLAPALDARPVGPASEPPRAGAEPPALGANGTVDPTAMTVDAIETVVRSMGGQQLEDLMLREKAGKDRKGAVAVIQAAMDAGS